jgi:hypothetical protein
VKTLPVARFARALAHPKWRSVTVTSPPRHPVTISPHAKERRIILRSIRREELYLKALAKVLVDEVLGSDMDEVAGRAPEVPRAWRSLPLIPQ